MSAPDDGFDFFGPAPTASPADGSASTLSVPGRLGFAPAQKSPPLPTGKTSRWAKSDTTFGPVGRLVCTVALIIPFTFLVGAGLLTFDPFVLGGAGIWAGLMVMGLRQTWQVVHHHHRR